MTEQKERADDEADEASEDHEDNEFELEGLMNREEGANVLRRLADSVEDASVDLGREEGPVAVPDQFEVELEYEETEGEAELEVELEWSLDDGEAVAADESDES